MPLAVSGDRALGLRQSSQPLAFPGDLAVELCQHTGRREDDEAFQRGIEQPFDDLSEKNGVGGAIERREWRELKRLGFCQVADQPIGISARLLRARQGIGTFAATDEMLEQIAADQAGGADHKTFGLLAPVHASPNAPGRDWIGRIGWFAAAVVAGLPG